MNPVEIVERRLIVDVARTWLGTPHVHNQRVVGAGVDCGQFIAAVFESVGLVEHVDLGKYPPDWYLHRDDSRYQEIVERFARRVHTNEPRPGDIALFNFGRCIGHGAIVVEWPLVIHAYLPNRQVVIDDVMADARLQQRLVGFWRLNRWRD